MDKLPEPLAHEMRGANLSPGMATFIRVEDHDGNVKFRLDCVLIDLVEPVGCSGLHFKTADHKTVCYYQNGRVWAKVLTEKEMAIYGNSRNNRKPPEMADTDNGSRAVANRRQANRGKTKTPRRDGDMRGTGSASKLHGQRSKSRSTVERGSVESGTPEVGDSDAGEV
jgi:hypothetical protein